jgi:hypothetical protein
MVLAGRGLSRKRVMNPERNIVRGLENIVWDSADRIARCFIAMSIVSQIACRRIHTTLSLALFAACAANLALLCTFL